MSNDKAEHLDLWSYVLVNMRSGIECVKRISSRNGQIGIPLLQQYHNEVKFAPMIPIKDIGALKQVYQQTVEILSIKTRNILQT